MQTSQISSPTPESPNPVLENKSEATKASSDFQTFLSLLTAQMRNQDPLKPMESTAFVAQLASFSAVEQQIETNTKLDQILGQSLNGNASEIIDWIGRQVQHGGSTEFTGQPVDIQTTVHPSADRAQLVVADSNSNVVFTKPIEVSSTSEAWNGATFGAQTANKGRYNFTIHSFVGETLIDSRPGLVFDNVVEARLDDGITRLMFADGTSVDSAAVTSVR